MNFPKRTCLERGILAGFMGGLFGGLPSLLLLDRDALNSSIRSIAYVAPGNHLVRSDAGRWMLGATTHMCISVVSATMYVCFIKKRPLLFALALWAFGYHGLGPEAMRRQDKSKVLADHLAWSIVVDAVNRAQTAPARGGRG